MEIAVGVLGSVDNMFKGMPNTRLTTAKWMRIRDFLRSDPGVYVKDEAELQENS